MIKQDALRKYIGDKAFYKTIMAILIPVTIQNFVTNFVNFLDNIMIGALGTAEISAVSVTNQLMFVFNITIFGLLSGPGIFGVQFFGKKDMEGVRSVFRLSLWLSLVPLIAASLLFTVWDEAFIAIFLKGGGERALAESIMRHSKTYLHIMLAGLPAFVMTQCYVGIIRGSGHMRIPMVAGIAAVLANLVGNYILIFGRLGLPRMGVAGAAWATVLSRYVEMSIVMYAAHTKQIFSFIRGVYRKLSVPFGLVRQVFRKGSPLMMNEFVWSIGMSMMVQTLTLRGLDVLAANNISMSVANMFRIILFSMGTAVSVIIGQELGAGDIEKARVDAWRLIGFGFASCAAVSAVMALLAPYFPLLYNTEDGVRKLATGFLWVLAFAMPFHSIGSTSYFILRSGGRTFITFLFDSGYLWALILPVTRILVVYTRLDVVAVFLLSEMVNATKSILGVYLVNKGIWARNIVGAENR